MATKTRLVKAINGLTELIARHTKQDQIKISKAQLSLLITHLNFRVQFSI